MDKNFLLDLCKKINLGKEETLSVISTLNLEFAKVAAVVKKCSMLPINAVLHSASEHERNYRQGAALCLACVIACCERTYGIYREKGIPDEIFYDTMSDITIWAENFKKKFGYPGFGAVDWICHHLNATLFRLGRLQFQLYRTRFPDYTERTHIREAPIKQGKRCLYVHIPQGKKLDYEECVDSFRRSKEFFREFFPNYKYCGYICESWLLYPGNRAVLPPESNIMKFQSLWNIVSWDIDQSQAIERIFHPKCIGDIEFYPEDTSLRRAAKKWLLSGNVLGIGFGMIKADDEEKEEMSFQQKAVQKTVNKILSLKQLKKNELPE